MSASSCFSAVWALASVHHLILLGKLTFFHKKQYQFISYTLGRVLPISSLSFPSTHLVMRIAPIDFNLYLFIFSSLVLLASLM